MTEWRVIEVDELNNKMYELEYVEDNKLRVHYYIKTVDSEGRFDVVHHLLLIILLK